MPSALIYDDLTWIEKSNLFESFFPGNIQKEFISDSSSNSIYDIFSTELQLPKFTRI